MLPSEEQRREFTSSGYSRYRSRIFSRPQPPLSSDPLSPSTISAQAWLQTVNTILNHGGRRLSSEREMENLSSRSQPASLQKAFTPVPRRLDAIAYNGDCDNVQPAGVVSIYRINRIVPAADVTCDSSRQKVSKSEKETPPLRTIQDRWPGPKETRHYSTHAERGDRRADRGGSYSAGVRAQEGSFHSVAAPDLLGVDSVRRCSSSRETCKKQNGCSNLTFDSGIGSFPP